MATRAIYRPTAYCTLMYKIFIHSRLKKYGGSFRTYHIRVIYFCYPKQKKMWFGFSKYKLILWFDSASEKYLYLFYHEKENMFFFTIIKY